MPILCGNWRVHGNPPTVYHNNLAEIRACSAGESVPDCGASFVTAILERSGGVLGRRGGHYRATVDAAWRQYVIDWEFFDGDLATARDCKIRFYRRFWILPRDIDLVVLW